MSTYVKITVRDDIPEGTCKRFELGKKSVALFNIQGQFFAIEDTCSHEEASLSQGELDGYLIECPLHGSRFDVRTGQATSLPAVLPVTAYRLMVEGDDILISMGSE